MIASLFLLKKFIKPCLLTLFIVTPLISCLLLLEAYVREQTLIVQKIISEHRGSDFVFAEDPEAKKELWKVKSHGLLHSCSFPY